MEIWTLGGMPWLRSESFRSLMTCSSTTMVIGRRMKSVFRWFWCDGNHSFLSSQIGNTSWSHELLRGNWWMFRYISMFIKIDKCQRFLLLRLSARRPFFQQKHAHVFFPSKEKWKKLSRSPTRTPRSTDRLYDVYARFQQEYPTNRPRLGAGIQTKTNLFVTHKIRLRIM